MSNENDNEAEELKGVEVANDQYSAKLKQALKDLGEGTRSQTAAEFQLLMEKLRSRGGVTIEEGVAVTNWSYEAVLGALTATVNLVEGGQQMTITTPLGTRRIFKLIVDTEN